MKIDQLIDKCINQDRAAQKQLYLEYADHVMSIARRYGDDQPEQKDIVQNTFVRVFYALEKYNSKIGDFKAWISRVCINEAIAIKRKKKRIYFIEDQKYINESAVENQAISQFRKEEIHAVMEALEPGYKLVMQMYFFDELSTKEMAEILQLKESSIRSKVSRARQKFINHWKMSDHYEF